jgi:hypothetical protein
MIVYTCWNLAAKEQATADATPVSELVDRSKQRSLLGFEQASSGLWPDALSSS